MTVRSNGAGIIVMYMSIVTWLKSDLELLVYAFICVCVGGFPRTLRVNVPTIARVLISLLPQAIAAIRVGIDFRIVIRRLVPPFLMPAPSSARCMSRTLRSPWYTLCLSYSSKAQISGRIIPIRPQESYSQMSEIHKPHFIVS